MHIEFSTTDIILAACLKLDGYVMIEIERKGNKGTFVFANVDKDFITKFDLGQMQVEPVTFNQNIKTLTTAVRRMN